MELRIDGPGLGRSAHAEPILRALPEWFGIESALAQYVEDVERMPTFLAHSEGAVVGFLAIHRHFSRSAEVHVVGVLPASHRSGFGRALQLAAEDWLIGEGVEYLQVKTISESSPDPNYARMRDFYERMGFVPLEEFPTLWDEHNPCLVMVKRLASAGAP